MTGAHAVPATAVTVEDVRRVAELANLELSPAEEPRMQRDLNAILTYIAQLGQLDTTGIEPMAQVSEILPSEILTSGFQPSEFQPANTLAAPLGEQGANLRPDRICPSVDRRAVMHEAPESDGRFFKVPKVIER